MSAVEEIREAAALMRQRASGATPGPWEVVRDIHGSRSDPRIEIKVWSESAVHYVTEDVSMVPSSAVQWQANAEHIASWHPAVALAVADFLDLAATHEERAGDDCGQGYGDTGYGYIDPSCSVCGTPDEYAQPWPCETVKRALMLARAYLGRSS